MTHRIWVLPEAEQAIRAEAARCPDDETGGLLLGYRTDTGTVIADTVGPGPAATRTPTSFHPDDPWQQEQLAEKYSASGRLHTYLGDWHTHPHGIPRPSRTDRRTLTRIARHRPARQSAPLTAILAPDSGGPIAVWLHTGRWTHPHLLAVVLGPTAEQGHLPRG